MLYKLYYLATEFMWLIGLLFLVGLAIWGMRGRDKHNQEAKKKWNDTVAKKMHEPLTLHPEIDDNLCGGCAACVRVCPEGEIIKMINHKAVLVEPTKCVGHGACEVACPFNAIHLVFGTKSRGMELPKIDPNYQTNVKGLYIAGELGGMGLIRNAVKQGKLAAQHAAKSLKSGAKVDVDVLIVGAGPAGLAASMAMAEMKKSYLCIEQANFGGTIYSFPRQKVVMSHPMEFPMAGQIKFPKNKVSKEEILAVWQGLRQKYGLKIKENSKFVDLKKRDGVFHVQTSQGLVKAQKVILGMGVRGSPRKLGVPNEGLPKVTYNLLDPEQYQRKWIAVVGGGNAAVEAAQYLARAQYQNKVFLLVRGERMDRCNEDNQNLILDLERKKRVKICYKTSVKEVQKDYIIVDSNGENLRLQNDFLFIFAGAEMPFKFLKGLGIMIQTKYGEPLKTG